jgi:hypothetical protein
LELSVDRDLCSAVGLRSSATMNWHLQRLQKAGQICRDVKKAALDRRHSPSQ